jgi:tripartite-type tricarboxylate transporter receptor subunit TctC
MLRSLHRALLIATASSALVSAVEAQTYPDRPIKVVVPFAAGSASDVVTRLVLEKMSPALGQPFVIENQPGGGGNSGTLSIARSEPDGYKLLMSASGPLAVNKTLTKNLPYDPEKDFEPISLLATLPNVVVVSAKVPIASLQDLIAHAKAKPGELNYSSVGNGSSQHLAGVLFEQLTGTRMTHVPYRITGQLVTDLITGVVPLSFQNIANVLGQVQSGNLRPLAIAAKNRSATLPDVPTAAEAGLPGYESSAWFALLAPRGTPKPIVEKLNLATVAALQDADLRKRLTDIGAEPVSSSPEDLRAFISAEVVKWRDIITRTGVASE